MCTDLFRHIPQFGGVPGSGMRWSCCCSVNGVPVLPSLDELAPQTLGFELPVTEDVTLAGPVAARLTFSCNEIDSYVIPRLSRVDADGHAHQLSLGALRPVARSEDPPAATPSRSRSTPVAARRSCRGSRWSCGSA